MESGSTSTTVTATPPALALVAPSGLMAASTVRGRVDLAWTNPVSSTTYRYRVVASAATGAQAASSVVSVRVR